MSRLPNFGVEWGECTTCSRGFPVTHLVLTRRYGWQCLPGLWGEGCYDGPVQRDELRYIPRPGEGVRKSIAPIYDLATMGFTPGDRVALEFRFTDHATGIVYDLSLAAPFPTFTTATDQAADAHGGWEMRADLRFWFENGLAYFGAPSPEVYKFIPVPTLVSLAIDEDGALVYGQI